MLDVDRAAGEFREARQPRLRHATRAARPGHLSACSARPRTASRSARLAAASHSGLCGDSAAALRTPGRIGCRSTSQSWCSISTITRDAPLKPRTAHCRRRPGAEAATHDLFRGARRQSRHGAPLAGRRPASRSGARRRQQLEAVLARLPTDLVLSLGRDRRPQHLADRSAMPCSAARARRPRARQRQLMVAPSCSLAACPGRSRPESELDRGSQVLARFRRAEAGEVATLSTRARTKVAAAIEAALAASARSRRRRAASSRRVHDPDVRQRLAAVTPAMARRAQPPSEARRAAQRTDSLYPLFPTTTIGSFPQTATRSARRARGARERRARPRTTTTRLSAERIDEAVRWQEEIGLDVLVHGEFERNDMVKYFGEQLERLSPSPSMAGCKVYGSPLRAPADHLRRRRTASIR